MFGARCLRQVSSTSTRALASRSVHRSVSSLITAARPQLASSQLSKLSLLGATRQFTSERSGTSDVSLVQKLQEEINYEKEAREQGSGASEESDIIKQFRKRGVWQIEDSIGKDEVTLTRTFGSEKIRIMFSIADVDTQEPYESEEVEEGEEPETPNSFPLRVSITLSKEAGKGAVHIDAVVQDAAFLVDNLTYYSDEKLATDLSPESDWKRRGLYVGPQFDQLDPSLQEEFEKYLAERGIDEELALFLPEFAEHKEQQEYVHWLNNVKNFVEA